MNLLKTTIPLSLIGALFLSASVSYAEVIEIKCPAEINSREKLENVPQGFETMAADASQYWVNVTFYSGKPEENASLAPDSSKKTASWTFSDNETLYLSCAYNQSKIELFKMLPKNIRSCELVMDKHVQGLFGKGLPEKIRCTTR